MGGDMNSRPGDLNALNTSWHYNFNVDVNMNGHGRGLFSDMCKTAHIMPINHLRYKRKEFAGDFTYHKGDSKSQIDFALTDASGRKCIQEFEIIQDNWHLADHKPITLKLSLPIYIDSVTLYRRAVELNHDIEHTAKQIPRHNKVYNYCIIENFLLAHYDEINGSISRHLENNDIENALIDLDKVLHMAH